MRILRAIASPPPLPSTWDERWNGEDRGMVCCWLRGIEKAREDPDLAMRALSGELPVLTWKGGVTKALKSGKKVGSMNYLATWQGLRGEDLDLDLDAEPVLTCTRTRVQVRFTTSTLLLLAAAEDPEDKA